jgi:glycosyltransferase involved in cell wall biosynthesis
MAADAPGGPIPTVSIVVPVFDERGNLEPLHEAILESMDGVDFELLFVDDGSTDGSAEILDAIAQRDHRTRVLHFVRNYGQTAALTAGIRNSRAEILVTLDADLQNDPADIPLLIEHLETADLVCGWRKDRKDTFLTRVFPSRIANWLIARLSKVPLHDYGCTLRAYRRSFVHDVPLYGEMHRFLPIYVTWAGARVTEVPVRHHPRTRERSKYGLTRVPKVLLDLTTLKFLRDFFVTPIYFFGWVGFLLCLFGMVAIMGAALCWTVYDHVNVAITLSILGPGLLVAGVIEITLGIVAEVLIRMHFELQSKDPYRIREELEESQQGVARGVG